jgi:Spy/CpxP family protein refolding chaperone
MSTTEPFPPAPFSIPAAQKPRRLRRVLFATALLLAGGVIGAVVAGPTLAQRWDGGPPWAHGHGFGPHGMSDPGARMFFPGPIERGVERLGWATDASSEQKTKINTIAQKAADDIFELRAKHLEARKQVIATLTAPTIDRAKLETLRADQMKLAEAATKRITDAVADIGDVLTPAQRADLGQRIERWQRWFRT